MQIRQMTIPNKTLFTLTQTFRYLNCCCNFFLYSATSSLFRRELSEIFQCINQKHRINVDDQRRKPSSAVPLYTMNQDSTLSERQNLLLQVPTQVLPIKPTNDTSTLKDSKNGHTNSLKT